MPGTIVCGYDGTDGAKAALAEAVRLAGEIGGDVLVVFAYKKVVVGGESRDLDEEVQERAAAVLGEGAAYVTGKGVAVGTEFAEGSPAEVLTAAAEARKARYIVTGSYGEKPLKAALIGSTPFRLVHLASTPVIVVRVPEDD